MKRRRLLSLLRKAQIDIDEALHELVDGELEVPECDAAALRDLAEVQHRIRALEMRVSVIEGRPE